MTTVEAVFSVPGHSNLSNSISSYSVSEAQETRDIAASKGILAVHLGKCCSYSVDWLVLAVRAQVRFRSRSDDRRMPR